MSYLVQKSFYLVLEVPLPSIHPLSLVMSSVAAGAGSSTHTLSVPPSTDRIYLAMNLASSETTSQLQDGPAVFELSFDSLQVQYAGQSAPASGYPDLYAGHPSRGVFEGFLDYQPTAGKLYSEGSSVDDIAAWSRNCHVRYSDRDNFYYAHNKSYLNQNIARDKWLH